MAGGISREEAANWWLRCISCSETSVTPTNRDAGVSAPLYEQVLHLFSGGFMHRGQARGHLWGAVLSAGIRAAEKLDGEDTISAATLEAARRLAGGLSEDGWASTCSENSGCDFTSLGGKINYLRSDKPKACGRKALVRANRANCIIDEVLVEYDAMGETSPCENRAAACMSKIADETGHGTEEIAIVAGFAGGLGLSGNICGALAVGVFALSVRYCCNRDPERRDSKMRAAIQELNLVESGFRKLPSRLQRDFKERMGHSSIMITMDVYGHLFPNNDDTEALATAERILVSAVNAT